jgi:N-acetylmuramoyl-L-alanine amidase
VAAQPALASPPSRRYTALDELASQLGAGIEIEDRTAIVRLRRQDRQAAVVPGMAFALVGSELVELDREVTVYQGRAYVPRDAARAIERLFRLEGVVRPPPPAPPRPPAPGVRHFTRICLDPGHGGKDPGAISSRGLREKHVVLATAQAVAEELTRRGIEVVWTRDDDVFIELNDRPALAARQGADAFLAIHANAMGDRSVTGIELFYCDDRYDTVAVAADATRAGRSPLPKELGGSRPLPAAAGQAALQMLLEEYQRESRELAAALQSAFARAGLQVRSVRSAGYRVLRLAETPAVLVEIGFLTNRNEEALLRTDSYRRRLAAALADGVDSYRRSLERGQELGK